MKRIEGMVLLASRLQPDEMALVNAAADRAGGSRDQWVRRALVEAAAKALDEAGDNRRAHHQSTFVADPSKERVDQWGKHLHVGVELDGTQYHWQARMWVERRCESCGASLPPTVANPTRPRRS